MQKKKLTRKEKFSSEPKKESTDFTNSSSRTWIPGLIIVLLGIVLYSNTLNHDYTLDDYSVILENRLTKQGFSAIPEIFKTSYRHGYYFTDDNLYRPVVKAMFAIEWGLSPRNATPGHLANVLLYALSGFILFHTLLRLTSGNTVFAFIASALFIAHPVHTEVVASIKSRDEILAFLFSIWALERYVSALKSDKKSSLFASLALYFIALLSKESAITFLAVFPLAGWFFTRVEVKKIILKLIPLIVVAGLFLLIRAAVLQGIEPVSVSVADNLLMAAKSPLSRFATAVMILGLYLKILIFPHPLVFDYSFNQIPIVTVTNWKFMVSALAYVGMLVFAIVRFKSRDILSFSILFFLITLSVSSNIFITIGSSMGERFLYAPSLGFCLALTCTMVRIGNLNIKALPGQLWNKLSENKFVFTLFILLILGYSAKTVSRNPVWKNNYTLYSNDVHLSPESTRTHYYLGNYLVKDEAFAGKPEEQKREILYRGIASLQRSIAIYPGFADAHTQMGVAYYKLNNLDSALIFYRKGLELNPKSATLHNNIGTIYFTRQQYDEALRAFLQATAIDPRYSEAHANAGSAYGSMQQFDKALESLFLAVKYDPNYAQAYYFIGLTYRFKGDEANAQTYLEKAYRMDPNLKPAN